MDVCRGGFYLVEYLQHGFGSHVVAGSINGGEGFIAECLHVGPFAADDADVVGYAEFSLFCDGVEYASGQSVGSRDNAVRSFAIRHVVELVTELIAIFNENAPVSMVLKRTFALERSTALFAP